tara:strand:- start:1181 stop:1666 length:486 start_codon:yes stop_codon:yes gene_type:complete
MSESTPLGPTGEILRDLPSPYLPHSCGLLHLPRFLAKIRKHLDGELPKSYQRNFRKGFDGFLCLHLGIEPEQVVEIVESSQSDEERDQRLREIFPDDLKVHVWNRKVTQMGMSEMGRERLEEVKASMGLGDRTDLLSFADMIDVDEGKIPGYDPANAPVTS